MKRTILALLLLCLPVVAFAQRPALNSPVFRALDINGKPLVGGKLFSYAAGTTTPLATYVDSTTSTLNTNPVILDISGQARIFLGSSVYKFVLQDASGVVQWTADNITQGGGSTGSGTVTVVTAQNLADAFGNVLWTAAVDTPTTTPNLHFSTVETLAPNKVLASDPSVVGSLQLRYLVPADLPLATGTTFGAIKPDGTSCTVTAGVLSCAGGSGGTPGGSNHSLQFNSSSSFAGTAFTGPVFVSTSADPRVAVFGDIVNLWTSCSAGYLKFDGSCSNPAGAGTVTSVALTAPGIFAVGGSPITSSGTLALTLANQAVGTAFLGPVSGSPAAPTFRSVGAVDVTNWLGYKPQAQVGIPTASQLGLYTFTETSGNLLDRSGHGNDCTATSSSGIVRTGIGYSYTDNTGQYDCPGLNGANSFYYVVQLGINHCCSNPVIMSANGSLGTHAVRVVAPPPVGSGSSGSFGITVQDTGTGGGGTYLASSTDFFAGAHVIAVICPVGSPPLTYLDGHPSTAYNFHLNDCHNAMTAGNFGFGPNADDMYIFGANFYSSVDGDAEVALVSDAMRIQAINQGAPFKPQPYQANLKYGFNLGDSITCFSYDTPTPTCGAFGSVGIHSWGVTFNAYTTVATGYTAYGNGTPGAFIEQQISYAPYIYAPLCNTGAGQSQGTIFEGTNNFLTNYSPTTASAWASHVADLNWTFINQMIGAGCNMGLVAMIDRLASNPGTLGPDGAGNSYETDMFLLNDFLRKGWKANKANLFVDLGSDPVFGAVNAALSTTYYTNGGGGTDYIHPSLAGENRISQAFACLLDDVNSPKLGSQAALTSSVTLGCGMEYENFDVTAGSLSPTLGSAMWQTGRDRVYCNATPAATGNTLTINAPGSEPFVGGATSVTVPRNSCYTFTATFNESTATPGNNWQVTNTGSGGGSSGISGLTANYIPKAGSATTITANSHLDDGVTAASTITSTEAHSVNLTGAALPALPASTIDVAANVSGTATRRASVAFGATPFFSVVAAGGTATSPTAITATTQIGGINGWAHNGSGWNGPIASLRFFANENQTPSAAGSYADIATTPNGSTTLAQVMKFESDGGMTTPGATGGDKGPGTINAAGFYVNNVAVVAGPQTLANIAAGTAPTSSGTYNFANNVITTTSNIVSTGAINAQTQGTATSGANFGSALFGAYGSYWNGSSSNTDSWQWVNTLGAGTNPTSTLAFTHSGTSGAAAVSLPALILSGISGTGPICGNGTGNALTTSGCSSGSSGLSGMTVTQIPIAASATTVTSSIAIGAGAVICSGPASGLIIGHVASFTATTNCQIQDSGIVAAQTPALNATLNTFSGSLSAKGWFYSGTKFTNSGCSVSASTGGAMGGTVTLGANTCTLVITPGVTATNGFHCSANDRTAPTILIGGESSSTTTTASFTIPAGAGASDLISFGCFAF